MRMNLFLFSVCLALLLNFAYANVDEDWASFKKEYNKKYASESEEQMRKEIFVEKVKEINEHNEKYEKGEVSYKKGINEFTDLTAKEFQEMQGFLPTDEPGQSSRAQKISMRSSIPDYVNWVERGFNTFVKHQSTCGSCYAFSSVAAIEAQYFKKHNKLIVLSPQEIVDCTQTLGNLGCKGGYVRLVYQYVKENGITLTSQNPYRGQLHKCIQPEPRIKISNYYEIPYGNETHLQRIVATVGPVPVDLDSTQDSWREYKEGVYYEPKCSPHTLSHSVLLVGYGTTEKGEDYWLIKNSYGLSWGDKGYMKLARNRGNHCGIATRSVYPVIE